MTRGGNTIEETFNQALASSIRSSSAQWREDGQAIQVEKTQVLADGRGRRPDILVLDGKSHVVVIESSFDPTDADKDAKQRLGGRTAQGRYKINTALSVHIPDRYKQRDLKEIEEDLQNGKFIRYALHQVLSTDDRGKHLTSYRWPRKGFLCGTVCDLARFLQASIVSKEDVERVADEVAEKVRQAAGRLEKELSKQQQERIAEVVHQHSTLEGLRTSMVLWLNALLTQQRLANQGIREAPPLPFSKRNEILVSQQIETWRALRKKNWRSILKPAITSLAQSNDSSPSATKGALELLVEAVEQIESMRLGLHINVGAELFPRLSNDRKESAAFYTQSGTAEMLSALTIRKRDISGISWCSKELFNNHRLADLACGTGTLLRSGYRRICQFHEEEGGTVDTVRALHRAAMEHGLIGTDISLIAAHLTASSLAAIGSGEPYGNTQVGWLAVGREKSVVGALEYFEFSSLEDLCAKITEVSVGSEEPEESVDDKKTEIAGKIVVVEESIDWILMNPPYSRTRKGQSAFDVAGLSEKERKACQRRWGKLIRVHPASNRAGMAASFLALARVKIKRGGRIGFVLPLTASFAESWRVTRQAVTKDFTDIIAIAVSAGQALGRDALSADTHMEEMLLVATRRKSEQNVLPPSLVHCVTLYESPMRLGVAGEMARCIEQALDGIGGAGTSRPVWAGKDEIGQVVVFDAGSAGNPWSPLGVRHADLALAVEALAKGTLRWNDKAWPLPIEMATLQEVFAIGPTHHLIGHLYKGAPGGAFELHEVQSEADAMGSDRALWRADAKNQRRLIVRPTHKGVAPAGVGSDEAREKMRQKKSTLHYARNMSWGSQALLAATTERPVMGGRAWTTLTHDDERVRKVFALWANSTLGMMVHWTQGQRTHAGRSTTQIGAVKKIPCPRLTRWMGTHWMRPPRLLTSWRGATCYLPVRHMPMPSVRRLMRR